MDPTYPLVPVMNFLGCILTALSISSNLFQFWNIGILSFAFWNTMGCFVTAVNAIIWSHNENNVAPVWCDITSHLALGISAGVPASTLSFLRRLAVMLRQGSIREYPIKRQRVELLIDVSLCIAYPVLCMAFYYIVQVLRYGINEGTGCITAMAPVGLTILIFVGPPLFFNLLSLMLYTLNLVLMYFRLKRELNNVLLKASDTTMNRQSYFKMLGIGIYSILMNFMYSLPLVVSIISYASFSGWEWDGFWPGWRVIHHTFPFVVGYEVVIDHNPWNTFLNEFLLFDHLACYRGIFWAIMKPFGITPAPRAQGQASEIEFTPGPVRPRSQSASTNMASTQGQTTTTGASHESGTAIEEVPL